MAATNASSDIVPQTIGDKIPQPIDDGGAANYSLLHPFMDQGRGTAAGTGKSDTGISPAGVHITTEREPKSEPFTAAELQILEKEAAQFRRPDPPEISWTPERLRAIEETRHETIPEKIEEVRAKLEKGVNELIPAADQALLKQLRDGALDANPAAMQAAYKTLEGDPQKLHAMVKELNSEFAGQESSVRLGVTDDNRLMMSADGKNGMVVSDKGVAAAKVTTAEDGYVHLSQEPGPSSSVTEVAAAVRNDLGSEDKFFVFSHEFYRPCRIHRHYPDIIWDKTPKDYDYLQHAQHK
jgi:hypothetical protein